MITSKICTKCKNDKILEEFNKQKDGKFGRKSICRICEQTANNIRRREKRATNISYFLSRVYDNMQKRCREQPQYQGKLLITREQFYKWGNETLPLFMEEHGLTQYTNQGITIDKIDDTVGYKKGNLQWLKHFDNTSKGTISRFDKPVLQYTMNEEFISEYPSIKVATESMGKNAKTNHQISKHLRGETGSAHGFMWKYKD